MKGYILLADGMRLDGVLRGARKVAIGRLVANTAVVGFQEMATDPAYKGCLLTFTYPEVGNVGVTKAFSESQEVQPAGLIVRVLSDFHSHYLAEGHLEEMLAQADVPCLTDVDTRGLAVHLRDHGEMPAAIAPADADAEELRQALAGVGRPEFRPSPPPADVPAGRGPKLAVLDLGLRRSQLAQLALCSRPVVFPCDATAEAILASAPAGVFVSDGPGVGEPPAQAVEAIADLLGKVPILACGLGHVALGVASGCGTAHLPRGHHGANYPVRNVRDGSVEVTQQRHTVMLDRGGVDASRKVELLWENINDGSVEGIEAADGSATGLQAILAAPLPGEVNGHIRSFAACRSERT